MPSSIRLAAMVLVLAGLAWSQQPPDKKPDRPPGPCDNAATTMENTNCREEQAHKADEQLSALYYKVQKAIQAKAAEDGALQGYRQRTLEKLRAAQLAWSRYRDAQCGAEEQQNEGGSIAPSVHAGCMKDLADRRMDELQKTYAIYLRAQ